MKPSILPLLGIVLLSSPGHAQVFLPSFNNTITIDFDSTQTGVNKGAFLGYGLHPDPQIGYLDSDAWRFTGFSDGNSSFGGNESSGDYARGWSSGNTSTGGIYGFETSSGNYALGIQASSNDCTPGSIILRGTNGCGGRIGSLRLSFTIWVHNNENYASSITPFFKTEQGDFQYLPEHTVSTGGNEDSSPEWSAVQVSYSLEGISILQDSIFEIGWYLDDLSGSGSRDEIALDNISITATEAVYFQGFETIDNWNLNQGYDNISSNTGATDSPASQRVLKGANSWQSSNSNDTLCLSPIYIGNITNSALFLRISASSKSGGNGLDSDDYLKIILKYPSLNDSSIMQIQGLNNAKWSFYTDSNFQAQSHDSLITGLYTPAAGGNRDAFGDGFGLVKISIEPNTDSLELMVISQSNHVDENWNIDNIALVGRRCTPQNEDFIPVKLWSNCGNKIKIKPPIPDGEWCLLLRESLPVDRILQCSNNFEFNTSFSSGEEIQPNTGIYPMYCGSDSMITLSNLNPNSTYFARFFSKVNGVYSKNYLDTHFISCSSRGLGINEDFKHGFDTVPPGWEFVGISNDGSSSYSPGSLKLDHSLDSIISPELCNVASNIRFWVRGQGVTSGSALFILGKRKNQSWIIIDSLTPLPGANDENWINIGLNPADSLIQFAWYYIKQSGNVDIDDITISISEGSGKTYTWTNATGNLDYHDALNYQPHREFISTEDSIIISSNTSWLNPSSVTLNNLRLVNASTLEIYQANEDGIIHLAEGENSLEICDNCSLKLKGNYPTTLVLNGGSQNIFGHIFFENSQAHQLLMQKDSLRFHPGSSFIYLALSSTQGKKHPFGESASYNGSVIFDSLSSYHSLGPSSPNPFGPSTEINAVKFKAGSNFHFNQSSGSPSISGRNYSNFYYEKSGPTSIVSGTSQCKMDSLIVNAGSLKIVAPLNLKIGGSINCIAGDSFVFDPPSSRRLILESKNGKIRGDAAFRLGPKASVVFGEQATYLLGNISFNDSLILKPNSSLSIPESDSLVLWGICQFDSSSQVMLPNNSSWIQLTSSVNIGTANFQITRTIPLEFANQYCYWSSPVQINDSCMVGPSGNLKGSRIYEYTPGSSTSEGYLPIINNSQMIPGKGYAVYGAQGFTAKGMINNDTIKVSFPVENGISGYSLIGNPYPSAINARKFLNDINNQPVLDGTLYLWSYNGEENYESSKQYIAVNQVGTSNYTRTQIDAHTHISSFQGFMVESNSNLPTGTYNIQFTNSMRSGNNSNFKSAHKNNTYLNWIFLANEIGDTTSCLLAQNKNFDFSYERGYDAKAFENSFSVAFINHGLKQSILAVPFAKHLTRIPISISTPITGTYSIGNYFDFKIPEEHVKVYLVDEYLETSTTLNQVNATTFFMEAGTANDRFSLVFLEFPKSPTTNIATLSEQWLMKNEEQVIEATIFNLMGHFRRIPKPQLIHYYKESWKNYPWIHLKMKNGQEAIMRAN
ncbi:hypothetical protein [Luteibaculum oceani]|uniref:MAM domain-containing protein n=1 Tax=Luteibaculum oceani TaxID=1294296 RepID=A0A5C6V118_9FLAO|nr:hypothetical protein [Luteibaculum oceani]TXC78654.1 hypothetical protein FRX97_08020 [Luteibaculum oceani]